MSERKSTCSSARSESMRIGAHVGVGDAEVLRLPAGEPPVMCE
jgi:hypothetical protein